MLHACAVSRDLAAYEAREDFLAEREAAIEKFVTEQHADMVRRLVGHRGWWSEQLGECSEEVDAAAAKALAGDYHACGFAIAQLIQRLAEQKAPALLAQHAESVFPLYPLRRRVADPDARNPSAADVSLAAWGDA